MYITSTQRHCKRHIEGKRRCYTYRAAYKFNPRIGHLDYEDSYDDTSAYLYTRRIYHLP